MLKGLFKRKSSPTVIKPPKAPKTKKPMRYEEVSIDSRWKGDNLSAMKGDRVFFRDIDFAIVLKDAKILSNGFIIGKYFGDFSNDMLNRKSITLRENNLTGVGMMDDKCRQYYQGKLDNDYIDLLALIKKNGKLQVIILKL